MHSLARRSSFRTWQTIMQVYFFSKAFPVPSNTFLEKVRMHTCKVCGIVSASRTHHLQHIATHSSKLSPNEFHDFTTMNYILNIPFASIHNSWITINIQISRRGREHTNARVVKKPLPVSQLYRSMQTRIRVSVSLTVGTESVMIAHNGYLFLISTPVNRKKMKSIFPFCRWSACEKTIQVRFLRISCDPETSAPETCENARTLIEEDEIRN